MSRINRIVLLLLIALVAFSAFLIPAALAQDEQPQAAEEDDHDHGDDHHDDEHGDEHDEHDDHDDHDDHHDEEHDHAHSKCACKARETGVGISCTNINMLLVSGAMEFLENPDNNCNSADACPGHYLVLQAHHDYCPHDALPESAEKVLHDFEEVYEDCWIPRQFDPELENCPEVQCGDSDLFTKAAETLESAGCMESCDADECKTAIQTILMGHDTCDEDALPIVVEKALHDYEDSCEAVLCNSGSTTYDPSKESCEEIYALSGVFN